MATGFLVRPYPTAIRETESRESTLAGSAIHNVSSAAPPSPPAAANAGLAGRAAPQIFHRRLATPTLENGCDFQSAQAPLGHEAARTMMFYRTGTSSTLARSTYKAPSTGSNRGSRTGPASAHNIPHFISDTRR